MHIVKTWGNVGINPLIRNLDTRWRWAVTFTARPLANRGKRRLEAIIGSICSPVTLDKTKILYPCRESNYNSSVAHPIVYSLYRRGNPSSHTNRLPAHRVRTFLHTWVLQRASKNSQSTCIWTLSYEVSRLRPSTDNTRTFWLYSRPWRMCLPRTRHGRYNYELCCHHELTQYDCSTPTGSQLNGVCGEWCVARPFRAAASKVGHNEYFNPCRTNIELNSTAHSVVPGPMSSYITVFLCWSSLRWCYLLSWTWTFMDFLEKIIWKTPSEFTLIIFTGKYCMGGGLNFCASRLLNY